MNLYRVKLGQSIGYVEAKDLPDVLVVWKHYHPDAPAPESIEFLLDQPVLRFSSRVSCSFMGCEESCAGALDALPDGWSLLGVDRLNAQPWRGRSAPSTLPPRELLGCPQWGRSRPRILMSDRDHDRE